MSRSPTALALLLTALALPAACQPSEGGVREAVEQRQPAINDGVLEPGMPAVVLLYHQWYGVACTGTIIGKRVVLTAKHCVQDESSGQVFPANGWTVNVGPNERNIVRSYRVTEVRKTSGSAIENTDVAVLILQSNVQETPYRIAFELPDNADFVGADALLVGYGVSSCPNGSSGTKFKTVDEVVGWQDTNDFVTEGQGANSGDSGGPIFDPDTLEVWGVMSRASGCDTTYPGLTVAVRVDAWRDFINQALEDTGDCGRSAQQDVCGDGIDNDCNGLVDDGCAPEGTACTADGECASRFCRDVSGAGAICTLPCDISVSGDCGAGAVCKLLSCEEAACAPGTPGPLAVGEACGNDNDCETLLCRDPGSGTPLCVAPCLVGSGQCLANEACAPLAPNATCGGCAPDEAVPGLRRLGERCTESTDCASGLCFDDHGFSYCTALCDTSADCSDGFHCREGQCARGSRGQVGEPCAADEDCQAHLSCYGASAELLGYCTTACGNGEPCQAGTVCDGLACALQGLPVGDGCVNAGDCSTQGCFAFGGRNACTLPCDRQTPCPPLTVCVEADNGMTLCQPMRLPVVDPPDPPTPKKKGCSTGGGGGGGLGLLLGLLLLALRRRRR